jgi:flagellin-specific chaperone FliS
MAQTNPLEAYRRVDFDARVAGADPAQLALLCYEQLIGSLGSALFAAERADNSLKSQSLTRALAALTALQLGVSGTGGVAPALLQMFEAARKAVLDSVLVFDPQTIGLIRQDFIEISRAMLRNKI